MKHIDVWIRKECLEKIRRNKTIIILAVAIPIFVYFITTIPCLPVGGNNDWAGFWGGYLGAILGALIAVYVMKETINNERTLKAREEKRELLIQIIDMSAEFSAKINRSNTELLRFHTTGNEASNYEAVYYMTEVSKMESILQIRLLANDNMKFSDELLDQMLNIGKATRDMHQVNVASLEELQKQADKIGKELEILMELAFKFYVENQPVFSES